MLLPVTGSKNKVSSCVGFGLDISLFVTGECISYPPSPQADFGAHSFSSLESLEICTTLHLDNNFFLSAAPFCGSNSFILDLWCCFDCESDYKDFLWKDTRKSLEMAAM